uniref:SCAN box domain-containing protein n=1 Tax=Xenopus tropicalis TaxID=8364 RepID=A0A803JM94_XENTR
ITEQEEQPEPETSASSPPSGLDELLKWMVLKQIESDQKHKVEEQRWRQDEAKRREEEQRRFQQEVREHHQWVVRLAPYLTGKAQKAYSSLNAQDYDYVKDAIFHRYELNVETFRQRFRAYRYSNFDGPREAYPERKTGEQILEMIALEQFIEILPDKVKLWVQEHRPETSTKAISLAEDFLLARREAEAAAQSKSSRPWRSKMPQLWESWTYCEILP